MKKQEDIEDLLNKEKQNINEFSMILPNQFSSPASPKTVFCSYVSIFRIDGVPILPPLMTTERKLEMQKHKEMALCIEKKFKNNNKQEQQKFPKDNIHCCNENLSKHTTELTGLKLQDENQLEETYLLLSNIAKKVRKDKHQKSSESIVPTVAANRKASDNVTKKEKISKVTKLLENSVGKFNATDLFLYINDPLSSCVSPEMSHDNKTNVVEKLTSSGDIKDWNECKQLQMSDKSCRQKPNTLDINKMNKPIPSICVNPPSPLIEKIIPNETFSLGNSVVDNITDETFVNNMSTDENSSIFSKLSQHLSSNLSEKSDKSDLKSNHDLETYNDRQMKRSLTSPSLTLINDNLENINSNSTKNEKILEALPRSNSFTLDFPSQALMQHLQQQNVHAKCKRRIPSKSINRDTIESKAKRIQKSETKKISRTCLRSVPSKTSNFNSVSSNSMINSAIMKSKRSNAEARSSTIKCSRPLKLLNSSEKSGTTIGLFKVKSLTSAFNKVALNTNPSSENITQNPLKRTLENVNNNPLTELKFEHRQRLSELIAQQQTEQKILQQSFEKQQKLLIEQLTLEMKKARKQQQRAREHNNSTENNSIMENQTISSKILDDLSGCTELNTSNDYDEESVKSASATVVISPAASVADLTSLSTFQIESNISSCFTTPRLPLNLAHDGHSSIVYSEHESTSSSSKKRLLQPESERRLNAANIINAYARGYLVRRLFKTDQIRRIVETIHETMNFIITLHLEEQSSDTSAIDNKLESNIRLKTRMLQQLSSASRTLHLVFFQTTVKERMDIIAHDRKRIITKMLAMNLARSPKIVHSF